LFSQKLVPTQRSTLNRLAQVARQEPIGDGTPFDPGAMASNMAYAAIFRLSSKVPPSSLAADQKPIRVRPEIQELADTLVEELGPKMECKRTLQQLALEDMMGGIHRALGRGLNRDTK
jgi:hypothetical protein